MLAVASLEDAWMDIFFLPMLNASGMENHYGNRFFAEIKCLWHEKDYENLDLKSLILIP
jgi:hypothetical protein